MVPLTIHDLDDETILNLQQLAAAHEDSVEEEARRILIHAVEQHEHEGLGTQITQRFTKIGGVELDIPERSTPRSIGIGR